MAHPRVDRYSQITLRSNHYSVPVRLIGRQVRVLLRKPGALPGATALDQARAAGPRG